MVLKLVDAVEITVLVEDSVAKPDLLAKHGLSLLVRAKMENGDVTIMMDTGPSPDVIIRNVDNMGVNLQNLTAVVLSHGHYDHTGGLIEVLKRIKKPIPVIVHPKLFIPKFGVKPHLRFNGTPFKEVDVEKAGGIILAARNPVTIADGIMTSGEIKRRTAFETVEGFWTVDQGTFIRDSLPDDQALIVNVKDKGLIVISGCAHSGIVNSVLHATRISGVDRLYAVLGGFHLIDADENRIQATIDELRRLNPQLVGPCHCTGLKAVKQFMEVFKDRCKHLQTGSTIKL